MEIGLKDLISIAQVSERNKSDVSDLLFDALSGRLTLFSIATQDITVELVPCRKEWIEEEGFYIDSYDRGDSKCIEIYLGQAIELNEKSINGLLINKSFSEVELYRDLGGPLDELHYDYWKTSKELWDFSDVKPIYTDIGLEHVYLLKSQIEEAKSGTGQTESIKGVSHAPSNTALKVIGLLMHHLAKSPKYASGGSPNKSQIKELLLDLAEELKVNPYGLSKVDERLLSDAMKYLEDQKN